MTDERKSEIAAHLQSLYAKHGQLTPALVVKDAKNPKSPIHREFDWDDGSAAARWREEQARQLIRSVTVTIVTDTITIKSVAYVRDPNAATDEQGYVSVESLRHDRPAAREALVYECNRAAALLERARHLALALGLAAEVDAALAGVTTLRQRAVNE
jgi:hypothetical protein